MFFIDRINRLNNSEHITATSPGGEAPLPPYGACYFGAINLARLIRNPFMQQASSDTDRLTCPHGRG